MSNVPIPRPRTQRADILKKPVPLPRTNLSPAPLLNESPAGSSENMSSSPRNSLFSIIRDEITERVQEKKKMVIETSKQITGDFSDRVQERKKSVIETSKQITGDLTDKVQEKKRAVIESAKNARQCVKKSVRRFGSLHRDGTTNVEVIVDEDKSYPPSSEIFDGITFESPMTLESKKKRQKNVRESDLYEEDDLEPPSFPPPSIPPPPLPDESLYEIPSSAASGSSGSYAGTLSSGSLSERLHYEEIFPDVASLLNFAQANGSDSDSDKTCNSKDRPVNSRVHRSESWSFYDSANGANTENVYNNITDAENIYANEPVPEEPSTPVQTQSPQLTTKEILSTMNIQRLSELSSVSVENSLYENHILQPQCARNHPETLTPVKRTTDSTLIEFDPLSDLQSSPTGTNDLSFLEAILQGDTYGTIGTNESTLDWSQSDDESEVGEILNPPTPPRRFDSLPSEMDNVANFAEPKTNWFVPSPLANNSEVTVNENTDLQNANVDIRSPEKPNWMRQRLSGVLQKLVPDTSKNITRLSFRSKEETKLKTVIEKPPNTSQAVITHQGSVIKVGRCGGVEDLFGDVNPRWCYLGSGKLMCYGDNTLKVLKETVQLESIISVQLIAQNKIVNLPSKGPLSHEDEEFHCFEITTTTRGSRGRLVLGTRNLSDRRLWMQKLIESQTTVFPLNLISDFMRAGWVYLREGASGPWKGTWLLLYLRELVYFQDESEKKSVDLRKARCIILQDADNNAPKTDDGGPQLLVDCAGGGALYIRTATGRNTRAWRQAIRSSAHNNGSSLNQQQLTNDNVPVIIDKCINFVYAHGSMAEGIYRRSGSAKSVTDILTEFSHDAWAVQLTKDRCTEHDVACVLKRFFRNLPEPAITEKLYPYFCKVSEMKSNGEKKVMYKKLLDQLPIVSHQTIKKLMSHLHFIQTQSEKNQMTVQNLATVWGPSLLPAKGNNQGEWSSKEISIVADLINLRTLIWPVSPEELKREHTMLSVLERYYQSSQTSAAARVSSGDLQVWIYLRTANSGDCYHITLNPQKTAHDICRELSTKINLPAHKLQLEESVLGDQLTRPIHYSERVLNVVLRWSYWERSDCKDNCLVLRPNDLYQEITAGSWAASISGELKYVDEKNRNFKNYMFEFSEAKLSFYKDKNCAVKLGEWKIEDIVWYIGHETKRDPHARWCTTFIPRGSQMKRTKAAPWFGNAIAGTDRTQQLRWLTAMALGEFPQGLIPSAIHVDLIES